MKVFTKYIVLFSFLFLLLFGYSNAYYFTAGPIQATDFPIVKTSFTALKPDLTAYQNLVPADFQIHENGILVPENKIQVICDEVPMSVVMVFDISTSMNDEEDGLRRIDMVKDAALNFINSVNLKNGSVVALTSFAGRSRIECEFSFDKQELNDSLQKIKVVTGTTNFNVAFFDNDFGAINMLKDQPPTHKRVVVFLTDGKHNSSTAVFLKDSIADELYLNNIQLYSITFLDESNANLNEISERSGGDYFLVNSQSQLGKIYETIAADLETKPTCLLIWETEPACDFVTSLRQAQIRLLRQPETVPLVVRNYKAPPDKFLKVELSEPIYSFDNPDIGERVTKEITIIPRDHEMSVFKIEIIPPTYFEIEINDQWVQSSNVPFVLAKDESYTFNVRFTPQTQKVLRQATILFYADPCPIEVPLIGGETKIKITKPVEGDVISACDKIEIQWEGIEASTRVNIFRSSNEGKNWALIAANRTGSSFTHTPPIENADYIFRVAVAFQNEFKWVKSFGGAGNDAPTSIAVQNNGLYNFVSGVFEGNMNTGNNTITSAGGTDLFLAKFDSDGNPIWSVSAGGPGNDRANGMVVDDGGNSFVTGECFYGARFGFFYPAIQYPDKSYLFLAHYSSNGEFSKVVTLGANSFNTNVEFRGQRIKYHYTPDMESPIIYVIGQYRGRYAIPERNIILDQRNNWTGFTAMYDLNFELLHLRMGQDTEGTYSGLTMFDNNGDQYTAASFTGSPTIGGNSLSSLGGTDVYIQRYGPLQRTSDDSQSIKVVVPKLAFTTPLLDLGDCMLGDSLEVETDFILYNDSEIPIEIKDAIINVIMPDDVWELDSALIGTILNPGDSVTVKIKFIPGYYNERRAELIITPDCGSVVRLPMIGFGVCIADVQTPVEFDQIYIGAQDEQFVTAIFCNPTNVNMQITPFVDGANWIDFEIYHDGRRLTGATPILVPADTCIDLRVVFRPYSIGTKTAFINYQINMACTAEHTILIGEAIKAQVGVNSIDWERRRVNGSYPDKLIINNPSKAAETIESITFINQSNAFRIVGLPQTPFVIGGEAELEYDIFFEPNAEQDYSMQISISVVNQEENAIGTFEGTGYLPKMTTEWLCPENILIDSPNQVVLTINNPSLSSDLQIQSITLDNTEEYEWVFAEPTNITIASGASEDFDIILTPKANSNHSTNVIISADDYDGTYTEEWKETVVAYNCDVLTIEYNDIPFNNVILCDTHTKDVSITNLSEQTNLIIYANQIELTGSDAGAFSVNLTQNINIPPGNTEILRINFNPIESKAYSAKLILPNSAGIPIEVNLTGIGVLFDISADYTFGYLRINKNNAQPIVVSAKSLLLDKGTITKLDLIINYNSTEYNFNFDSFQSQLGQFNWSKPEREEPGRVRISGTGNIPTPFDGALFKIDVYGYLTSARESDISISVDYECEIIEHFSNVLNIEEVCAHDLRVISVIGPEFSISEAKPNPASDKITIDYAIGYSVFTELTLFDVLGNEVETIISAELPAGVYQLNYDARNLPTGVYFIKLNCGHFVETRQIRIVK